MAEKSIDEHEPNRIGHQPEAQRQHRTDADRRRHQQPCEDEGEVSHLLTLSVGPTKIHLQRAARLGVSTS